MYIFLSWFRQDNFSTRESNIMILARSNLVKNILIEE